MKKILIISLLVVSPLFLLNSIAFAHCGKCGIPVASAQEGESTATFKGEIVCLGCTLKKEQKAKAQCSVYGHINGLRTSDGEIWTFLENDNSTKLIHNHDLAGKTIEIKGKKYENAHYIEVESFTVIEK